MKKRGKQAQKNPAKNPPHKRAWRGFFMVATAEISDGEVKSLNVISPHLRSHKHARDWLEENFLEHGNVGKEFAIIRWAEAVSIKMTPMVEYRS